MAIKREMHITISIPSYGGIDLKGDEAQNFLTAWRAYLSGGNTSARGALVKIDLGGGSSEPAWIKFNEISMVTQHATETEDAPDAPCEQVDCIPDYPPAPTP